VLKAIDREKQFKGWRREKKIALIESMNRVGKIWPRSGSAHGFFW
jgi:predicted GIY-YIG superfamily endonuclease